jgi:hypothetical protein
MIGNNVEASSVTLAGHIHHPVHGKLFGGKSYNELTHTWQVAGIIAGKFPPYTLTRGAR